MELSSYRQKVKEQFCQSANELAKLFKYSMGLETNARQVGARDGYRDVLEWMLSHGYDELKNVPIGNLLAVLQEKIDCAARQQFPYPDLPKASNEEQQLAAGNIPGFGAAMLDVEKPSVTKRDESSDAPMAETEASVRRIYTCRRKSQGP